MTEKEIKKHAQSLTDSPELQQALTDFGMHHVEQTKNKILKSVIELLSPEAQIMLVLEDFIKAEYNCPDFKNEKRDGQVLFPRYAFIFLCDWFINTKKPKSKFAKQFKKKTNGIKRTNSSTIQRYIGFKAHSSIILALKTIDNLRETDNEYKQQTDVLKLKAEILLTSCYR